MAIELMVNGYFSMDIYNAETKEAISADEEKKVLSKLQYGELCIGLDSKGIVGLDDLQKVLYTFSLETQCSTEYEFDEF